MVYEETSLRLLRSEDRNGAEEEGWGENVHFRLDVVGLEECLFFIDVPFGSACGTFDVGKAK